jgi:hypothetical protein
MKKLLDKPTKPPTRPKKGPSVEALMPTLERIARALESQRPTPHPSTPNLERIALEAKQPLGELSWLQRIAHALEPLERLTKTSEVQRVPAFGNFSVEHKLILSAMLNQPITSIRIGPILNFKLHDGRTHLGDGFELLVRNGETTIKLVLIPCMKRNQGAETFHWEVGLTDENAAPLPEKSLIDIARNHLVQTSCNHNAECSRFSDATAAVYIVRGQARQAFDAIFDGVFGETASLERSKAT